MNCTNCDAPLPPGATFCANCGTRVTQPSSAGAPTVALPAATGEQVSSSPPSSAGTPTMAVSAAGEQASAAPQPYTPQPYSSPQPYTPQPYTSQTTYPTASPPSSGTATVSLIFGILSWVILPVIGAIVAIIAGHMARREIRASGGQLGGSGLATAGLILGYAHIGLVILACIVFALLVALGAASSD
jgi:uncharacterized protein DUF4190/zinc ribbon protein